jgi:hypothetical protein
MNDPGEKRIKQSRSNHIRYWKSLSFTLGIWHFGSRLLHGACTEESECVRNSNLRVICKLKLSWFLLNKSEGTFRNDCGVGVIGMTAASLSQAAGRFGG